MDGLNPKIQPPELFIEIPVDKITPVRQDGDVSPNSFRGRRRVRLSFISSADHSNNSRSRSRDSSTNSKTSALSSLQSPLKINIEGNDSTILFKNEQDAGSLIDLSDDIRGALGDKSNTGTWLNQEKGKKVSKRSSFLSTNENNIELQSFESFNKGDFYGSGKKGSPDRSVVDVTSVALSQDNVGRSDDLLSSPNIPKAGSGIARFAAKFEDTYTTNQEGPQVTRLHGKSLKIFHPYNSFRIRCAGFIQGKYYEPLMRLLLLFQTTLLAYRQWNPAAHHGYVEFGANWADWVLLSINIIFTSESLIQIVAWGLWDDSEACKASNLSYSSLQDLMGITSLKKHLFGNEQQPSENTLHKMNKKSFISRATLSAGQQTIHRAYLRKSWNRLDFAATVSFWISLFLSLAGTHIYDVRPIFRVLECLRILRLSNITTRTSLLLKSIKTGGPQLVDVILFILYFMTLFAIIGVQSFKSSFRRYCVWTNPNDYTDTYVSSQHCGGSYYIANGTLARQGYFRDDRLAGNVPKGFLCPVNSECRTLLNPYGNTYGFDNLVLSMQLVFVIMSGNTFTDTMYDTMDTDSMAASIFFICGAFFLYLWMINLLIAVLSTSFSATREAVDSGYNDNIKEDFDLNWHFPSNIFSKFYKRSKFLFDILIFSSVTYQCLRNKSTTEHELHVDYVAQSFISLILLLEIILRFALYLPSKSTIFFKLKRNNVDLFLAIITSIISIPGVYNKMGTNLYDWFRVFFLIRFYRVVLDIPVVRKLWARVSNNFSIILNLALFYFLFLFLASILFTRYFEGWASEEEIDELQFPFNSLPNSFLGLFVVTSTENWSQLMYGMQEIAPNTSAAFFSGLLFVSWFLLSNSVILNAFIGIIGDSMRVLDNEKRKAQVVRAVHVELPRALNPRPKIDFFSKLWKGFFNQDSVEQANSEKETLLKDGDAIKKFLEDELYGKDENPSQELLSGQDLTLDMHAANLLEVPRNPIAKYYTLYSKRILNHSWISNPRKFLFGHDLHENPFTYSKKKSALKNERKYLTLPEQKEFENRNQREAQIEYLKENPMFGTSLYIFKPEHPLRKLCQKITNSSHGERLQGVQPNLIAYYVFNSIIAAATVALVVVASITTPLYHKSISNADSIWDWTVDFELAFGILFFLEFCIKVIADGSLFTPNGYFKNVWNVLDFVVLASIWTNIIAILKNDGDLSRIMRGLKALRALRILTINKTSKQIVYRVMVAGFGKIFIAGIMSFTLLFPYAVWGLNLFAAKLDACNDGESYYANCVNEYVGTAENWNILMPRVYAAPQLEFNRFASSLLTLFEVISLEGWTDLLQNLVNTTGIGSPPGNYTSPANAIFIVSFIFIGIIFVLTFFVSVIITNYSQMTGSAYLTLQQTSWNEVTKLLGKTDARQRPKIENLNPLKSYCYRITIEKNKWIEIVLFTVLWIHVLALSLEKYPSTVALNDFRYTVYIISSSIFLIYSLMKMMALGARRFFHNKWSSYEFLVYGGAWATSMISFFISRDNGFANVNKLFLVGIFTTLIHRSERLSHLLKIASASLPSLLSLIFAWGILFLVYAIAMNQIFGLTRIGPNTTDNQNLRTVTKALLLLFRCSFGEGWNYTMRDFAVEAPYCVDSSNLHSDCGSMQYAYILFISWNIISMYIFVNMFVSMIYESFIYVYIDSHGTSSLDREEIRYFKSVWSKFDPEGSGLIPLDKLPAFLRNLKGYFAFPLYTEDYSLDYLKTFISAKTERSEPYNVDIDFHSLNLTLESGVNENKKRLELYNKFLEEAKYNMEVHGDLGVSFSRLIVQIPLYTKFDENNCLTLTKFLDRLIINKILSIRLLNRKSVEIFRMIPHRLKFLKRFCAGKVENFRQNQNTWERSLKTPVLSKPDGFKDNFKSTEDGYWSPSKSTHRSSSFSWEREDLDDSTTAADDLLDGLKHSDWGTSFTEIEPHLKAVIENHLKGPTLSVPEETNEEQEENVNHGHRRIA